MHRVEFECAGIDPNVGIVWIRNGNLRRRDRLYAIYLPPCRCFYEQAFCGRTVIDG
jgi:hypothetical protein